jgi:hypothetical protein
MFYPKIELTLEPEILSLAAKSGHVLAISQ